MRMKSIAAGRFEKAITLSAAWVALQVVPALAQSPAPNFAFTIERLQGGPAFLSISKSNAVGLVQIEASTDLKAWQLLWAAETTERSLRLEIPNSTQGFYRAQFVTNALSEQLAPWKRQLPQRYAYRMTRMCFCKPFLRAGTVLVESGQVIGVTDVEQDGTPETPSAADLEAFRSVEQLIDSVEAAEARGADTILTRFDESSGFPNRIEFDNIALAVDDEVTYLLEDIRAN